MFVHFLTLLLYFGVLPTNANFVFERRNGPLTVPFKINRNFNYELFKDHEIKDKIVIIPINSESDENVDIENGKKFDTKDLDDSKDEYIASQGKNKGYYVSEEDELQPKAIRDPIVIALKQYPGSSKPVLRTKHGKKRFKVIQGQKSGSEEINNSYTDEDGDNLDQEDEEFLESKKKHKKNESKKHKKSKHSEDRESSEEKDKVTIDINDGFVSQGNNIIDLSKFKKIVDDTDERRSRLSYFLPKRYHWDPDENLGYFWYNGPKGMYAGPKNLRPNSYD